MALKPEQIGIRATDTTPRVLPQLDLAGGKINPKNLPQIINLGGANRGKFVVAPAWMVVTPDMLKVEPVKATAKKEGADVPTTS